MIVSINQPAYYPWRGYFDRIARSDVHIVLDHVQFEKGSYTNRTKIRLRDGQEHWLTVPIEKGKPINETMIVGEKWRSKHLDTLIQNYYSDKRGWRKHKDLLLPLCQDWGYLDALLDLSTKLILTALKIKTPTTRSSLLHAKGTKSELILNLCKIVGANVYLSGPGGKNYLDLLSFEDAGIEVLWHEHPPGISILDELFNSL